MNESIMTARIISSATPCALLFKQGHSSALNSDYYISPEWQIFWNNLCLMVLCRGQFACDAFTKELSNLMLPLSVITDMSTACVDWWPKSW